MGYGDYSLRGQARQAMAARVAKSYNAGTKPVRICALLSLSSHVTHALLAEVREGRYEGLELKEQR